jgi:hypothetical protein
VRACGHGPGTIVTASAGALPLLTLDRVTALRGLTAVRG